MTTYPPGKKHTKRKRSTYLQSTVISGMAVLLPAAVTFYILYWIYSFIRNIIRPLTNLITTQLQLQEIVAFLAVMALILMLCFLVGVVVRTAVGRIARNLIESRFLSIAPGYNLIKEIVAQFFGDRPNPFSKACLVRLFDSSNLLTAFVIDAHEGGISTVFIPTGPNPTSGFVLHVPTREIIELDTPVPEVMKSIIACGIGSAPLLQSYNKIINGQQTKVDEPPATA